MAQQQERLPSDSLRRAASQMELSTAVATPAGVDSELVVETKVSSPARDAWRRFSHNWAAMIALVIIIALVLLAALAPIFHTTSPVANDFSNLDSNPSPQHWFGTDGVGRDLYSRLLFGMRVPLIVGIVGAIITVFLGAVIGVISGYFGGIVDSILARFTDVMFAFPGFTLALIVVSLYGSALDPILGGAGRTMMLTVVFAIVGWPGLMRFVRSLALSMKEQQFIEAAKTVGTSNTSIIRKHLLPNMWGLILVQSSFIVVAFVGTEAVLSIFGLGVEAPNPDLGQMIWDGSSRLGVNYWEALFPCLALTLIILSFTFFGDGVRDAVDPRGKS
jgi:oligopeptide transport system permease protein